MKVTVKANLHWENSKFEPPHYVFWQHRMPDGPERVFISEHEYEVDVPDDFDPLPQVVAGLRERKQKILADSQLAANEIDDQIQRLLCIENKS